VSAVVPSLAMVLVIAAAVIVAALAARRAVRRPWYGFVLAALTLLIGVPFWVTCDHHLLKVLPTVWWFDPREPFAPYFLLYLPLSLVLAVTPAAALLVLVRLGASAGTRS
jgi:hypothetical protein